MATVSNATNQLVKYKIDPRIVSVTKFVKSDGTKQIGNETTDKCSRRCHGSKSKKVVLTVLPLFSSDLDAIFSTVYSILISL